MTESRVPLLKLLPQPDAPQGLFERVLGAIRTAEIRDIRNRFVASLVGLLAIIGYAAASWSAIWTEIGSSSFVEMLKLAASDPDIVIGNMKELLLGLLETLPLGSITLALIGIFSVVGAIALAKSFRDARRHTFILTLH